MSSALLAADMRRHVAVLAAVPRPAMSAALASARAYGMQELHSWGWDVTLDPFESADATLRSWEGVNLIARHREWSHPGAPLLTIGAHLDSRENSPGADDNASGVAALLEIARWLGAHPAGEMQFDLELVLYDLEELGMLGGAHRAAQLRQAQRKLWGMVSLEMLGYCRHEPGSQQLPASLAGLYPHVGNFIAVIGNQNSTAFLAAFRQDMEALAEVPVECLQVPDNGNALQATRLSDHSPFWDAGYPALMITDTSFLRNPYYHLPEDTSNTLDYDFLACVTTGVLHAIVAAVSPGTAREYFKPS